LLKRSNNMSKETNELLIEETKQETVKEVKK
jgi:hypothetical protein